MIKRGQITVFIILGILIVTVLAVILYLYNLRTVPEVQKTQEFDFSKTEVLKNYIEGCIEKVGNEALTLVGKQGGEINPGFYQYWNNDKISYMCYTTTYSACYNKKPFLLDYVQKELNTYVNQKITSCISDLEKVAKSKGYTLQTGNLVITTTINPYSTLINLDYPITIKSNTGAQVQQNKFSKTFNVPLGKLIKVTEDVTNGEIQSLQGFFPYQSYILSQNGEIELERHTFGNTEIYITNLRENNYKFQFAIQNYVKPFP